MRGQHRAGAPPREVAAVEGRRARLVELEEVERRPVDAGQQSGRFAAGADEAREPVGAAERGMRPMQDHVLVNPGGEAVHGLLDARERRREADAAALQHRDRHGDDRALARTVPAVVPIPTPAPDQSTAVASAPRRTGSPWASRAR